MHQWYRNMDGTLLELQKLTAYVTHNSPQRVHCARLQNSTQFSLTANKNSVWNRYNYILPPPPNMALTSIQFQCTYVS